MPAVSLTARGPFSLAASIRFLDGFTPAAYDAAGDGVLRMAFPSDDGSSVVGAHRNAVSSVRAIGMWNSSRSGMRCGGVNGRQLKFISRDDGYNPTNTVKVTKQLVLQDKVFAILGGQALLEKWVLSFEMTPIQFMLLSQAIIFVLGWPLEWTEIIVIFVPIFLPMLKHFNIDPVLWGVLVFVNLQAAFLSPPVAMSAFYLKGVSPPHVTLNQIFSGMMPYMLIVILCMVLMYLWPGMTLWLPNYLYGN